MAFCVIKVLWLKIRRNAWRVQADRQAAKKFYDQRRWKVFGKTAWSSMVARSHKSTKSPTKNAARRLLESISQPKPTKDKPTRNPKDSFRMFSFVFFSHHILGLAGWPLTGLAWCSWTKSWRKLHIFLFPAGVMLQHTVPVFLTSSLEIIIMRSGNDNHVSKVMFFQNSTWISRRVWVKTSRMFSLWGVWDFTGWSLLNTHLTFQEWNWMEKSASFQHVSTMRTTPTDYGTMVLGPVDKP